METTNARVRSEGGQALILFVFGLVVLLGFAAMSIDVGLAYVERRNLQNAVDAAALAGAQDLVNGESKATATATAVDYLHRHGFSAPDDTIEINIPPTSGQYAAKSGYIEVVASSGAPPVFLLLFLDEPYSLSAHAVALGEPATESSGDGDGEPPPPANVPPSIACGGPTVDGRVTVGDGYTKIGELSAGGIDHGDVFVTCDANFYYFAMRLNGPDTGGAVANENVYAGDGKDKDNECKPGSVKIKDDTVKKLTGPIVSVGADSFTVDVSGDIWTVAVDDSTVIELDKQPATIGDLAPGQEADVKGTLLGTNHALASKVEAADSGCGGDEGGGGLLSPTYHADYDTGWVESPKGKHTFNDLLGSDRARFQIACDGVARHDFIQDYLIETGNHWTSNASGNGKAIVAAPADSASSLEWNLEHPNETGWGDDPGEDPLVQSPPFNPSYPTYDAEYDGWIWEMIYEFKVPKGPYSTCEGPILFGLHEFSGSAGQLEGIHSSPPKTEDSAFLLIQDGALKLVE